MPTPDAHRDIPKGMEILIQGPHRVLASEGDPLLAFRRDIFNKIADFESQTLEAEYQLAISTNPRHLLDAQKPAYNQALELKRIVDEEIRGFSRDFVLRIISSVAEDNTRDVLGDIGVRLTDISIQDKMSARCLGIEVLDPDNENNRPATLVLTLANDIYMGLSMNSARERSLLDSTLQTAYSINPSTVAAATDPRVLPTSMKLQLMNAVFTTGIGYEDYADELFDIWKSDFHLRTLDDNEISEFITDNADIFAEEGQDEKVLRQRRNMVRLLAGNVGIFVISTSQRDQRSALIAERVNLVGVNANPEALREQFGGEDVSLLFDGKAYGTAHPGTRVKMRSETKLLALDARGMPDEYLDNRFPIQGEKKFLPRLIKILEVSTRLSPETIREIVRNLYILRYQQTRQIPEIHAVEQAISTLVEPKEARAADSAISSVFIESVPPEIIEEGEGVELLAAPIQRGERRIVIDRASAIEERRRVQTEVKSLYWYARPVVYFEQDSAEELARNDFREFIEAQKNAVVEDFPDLGVQNEAIESAYWTGLRLAVKQHHRYIMMSSPRDIEKMFNEEYVAGIIQVYTEDFYQGLRRFLKAGLRVELAIPWAKKVGVENYSSPEPWVE